MTYIELPRAVEAYFAFAELPATERGRQFTITFTYFEGTRLDRLQWWWQVSRAQERAGDALVQGLRQEAIQRFKQHIERWLVNSRRCLRGGEPFPLLETLVSEEPASVAEAPAAETSKESDYVETVREFARIAARR
jgi:CHAD domain-containing protein